MFVVTLSLGLFVVAALLLSPLYVQRVRLVGSAPLGAALVVGSVGLATVAASTPGRALAASDVFFLCLFALLLVGALLILGDETWGDDGDDWYDRPDAEPPWWPEFEAGFRRHLRQERRPIRSR